MAISTIGTNSLSDPIAVNGYTPTASNMQPFNRIINGAMTIDQRNAGAAVTPTAAGYYTVDRWRCTINVASKLSFQQSTTVPNNHKNSLAVTSLSAHTLGASDYFTLQQNIEGLNIADFGWGTSAAVDVTLSFWVRSSLTGTFGGCAQNSAGNRNYPFTYTINSANIWEQKSVTIQGDISGTWLTTNGVGISLGFGLGVGSTFSGTAGAWSSTYYLGATGAVSVVGTSGATFYITGVQLEAGSTASSFAYENFSDTLQKCQRYYQPFSFIYETSLGGTGSINSPVTAFSVPMRASPTMTASDQNAGPSTCTITSFGSNGSYLTGYYSYHVALSVTTSAYTYRYARGNANAEL